MVGMTPLEDAVKSCSQNRRGPSSPTSRYIKVENIIKGSIKWEKISFGMKIKFQPFNELLNLCYDIRTLLYVFSVPNQNSLINNCLSEWWGAWDSNPPCTDFKSAISTSGLPPHMVALVGLEPTRHF